MENQVKSGKEIVDDFFSNIQSIPDVDLVLADKLVKLYKSGSLTDKGISNELQKLRNQNGN